MNTNTFNLPQPATAEQINKAIMEAWLLGEIKIKPAKKFMGKLPPEGCEWYLIAWVMKRKKKKGVDITVMYNGAYGLKTAYKNEHLTDNDKLMGHLLAKLATEMQLDGKGIIPPMKAVN